MADLYNVSWMNETESFLDVVTGVGTSIGNEFLIGNLLLLSFFMVFLLLAFKTDFMPVLMIDAFITTILAIFLAFAGLISFVTIIYPAVIFFIVLIFYFFS